MIAPPNWQLVDRAVQTLADQAAHELVHRKVRLDVGTQRYASLLAGAQPFHPEEHHRSTESTHEEVL